MRAFPPGRTAWALVNRRKKIRKKKTLVRYGFAGSLSDKCKKNRLKTNHTKHPFGPKHRKESSL